MKEHTKENGLVAYDNNIFAKVKRFVLTKLWKGKNTDECCGSQYANINTEETECNQDEPKKKRSLYNFDAEDEDAVKNENINDNESAENFAKIGNLVRQEGENSIYDAPIAQDVEIKELEDNYIGMAKRELTVEEEKEELEKKLMRYYESIKKIANLSLE